MSNYNEQLKDLITQYEILSGEFKEIYPIYKMDSSNPEIQNMFNNIQSQIQNIFSQMETISMKLANSNEADQSTMNTLNSNINSSKKFYRDNKPVLQQIIDSNRGAVPREKGIDVELNSKYMDLGYIILLLGTMGYSLHKLLY